MFYQNILKIFFVFAFFIAPSFGYSAKVTCASLFQSHTAKPVISTAKKPERTTEKFLKQFNLPEDFKDQLVKDFQFISIEEYLAAKQQEIDPYPIDKNFTFGFFDLLGALQGYTPTRSRNLVAWHHYRSKTDRDGIQSLVRVGMTGSKILFFLPSDFSRFSGYTRNELSFILNNRPFFKNRVIFVHDADLFFNSTRDSKSVYRDKYNFYNLVNNYLRNLKKLEPITVSDSEVDKNLEMQWNKLKPPTGTPAFPNGKPSILANSYNGHWFNTVFSKFNDPGFESYDNIWQVP